MPERREPFCKGALASQLQHKPAKMHSMQSEILHNASVTTEPAAAAWTDSAAPPTCESNLSFE